MASKLLVVEDDRQQRRYLSAVLSSAGHEVAAVEGGQAALDHLLGRGPGAACDAVLLDLNMPDMDGLEVLRAARRAGVSVPVIVLTSDGSVARAVEAMRAGANDFLVKPAGPERLEVTLRNVLEITALRTDVRRLSRSEVDRLAFDDLIAGSNSIRGAIDIAKKAAGSDIPVLIDGESGTGKEVFARAIHGASARAGKPFVAVNCGALPEHLVESILFGHEKGAFTGAVEKRVGKFKEAEGGTLFLDEIGDLPPQAQVKLLRALQSGEIDPVGASGTQRVDVRLVSATHQDLQDMVKAGKFRDDLYYRISAFPLTLPALRDRRADLADLATMFLARYAASEGAEARGFSAAAMRVIEEADWPGNVRQLQNTIHRAVVLCDGPEIRPEHLVGLHRRNGSAGDHAAGGQGMSDETLMQADGHVRKLADVEAMAIERAIEVYHGRMAEVARRLGIGRSTLYRKLEELNLSRERRSQSARTPVQSAAGAMPRAVR